MAFCHLHVHTEFSQLDGHGRIKQYVAKAKELGMTALAITDHGYMYGVIAFYNECIAAGIKPIIGVELYTAANIYDRTKDARSAGHIVLLAKDSVGYQNLITLSSLAATDGFYYKPRIDLDLLRKYHDGIICLSACLQGDVQRRLLEGDKEGAYALAQEYKDIFGDDYYIELQYHGLDDQKKLLPMQLALAEELDIQTVATNDIHYLNREDAEAQRVLMCMAMDKRVDDETAVGYGNPDHWFFKSETEMREIFDRFAPEAISNTTVIADKCNLTIETGNYHLPSIKLPDGWSSTTEYFRTLCSAGLKKRYGMDAEKHREKLEHEMNVIEKMGFVDYFLIVFDIIAFAKSNGIPIGPGRGSAAGSIVSYCLGITDLEPTKYGLLFERFLNPERVTMPDVDIDIDPEGRDTVIQHIAETYGSDHVSQIITFGTLAAKSAIRDASKAMGVPELGTKLNSLIPTAPGITIKSVLDSNKAFAKEYESNPDAKKLVDISMSLEGLVRHTSTHAAGIIISPQPLTSFIPVAKDKNGGGTLVSQFDMGSVEQVGMLKVDLLGLKTLTVLRRAEAEIQSKQPEGARPFQLRNLRMADPKVYEMMSKGMTGGVFQFESEGMRDVLRKMCPTCFGDLIAAIALYRPGPMDSIPTFVENKHSPDKMTYLHPSLEPILKDTYSCIVFQEQVMAIVRELAGYSYGRADLVRRAMAKKKAEKMAQEREFFINGKTDSDGNIEVRGCIRNGIPEETAVALWDQMASFAAYAFNKSHAACYAVVAYQTAYLKCHYPLEFMAALMTNAEDPKKLLSYINECDKQNIQILPPDINHSDIGFTVEGNAIRFGLMAIKNTGKALLAELTTERKLNGPYTDLHDLIERIINACNKGTLEALIKSGALDSFPHDRAQMLAVLPAMLKAATKARKKYQEAQMSLEDSFFTGAEETEDRFHFEAVEYPAAEPLSLKEKLKQEQDTLGIYVSGHPMAEFKEKVKKSTTHKLCELAVDEESAPVKDGTQVRVAGIINNVRIITTKKKNQMCFMTIEDETGKLDVTVFPQVFEAKSTQLTEGTAVLIYGKTESSEYGVKVIADNVGFLSTEQ